MLRKLILAAALLAAVPMVMAADASDAKAWFHCDDWAATLVRDDTYGVDAWFDDNAGDRPLTDREATRFDTLASGTRVCLPPKRDSSRTSNSVY
ncbi:hypothetical protein SAMN06265795_12737 [Noviherbaspirillum humi]|uniref:Uncharacterized protein n=1 Tax=Noviherbaspirillum humi TaxID=1688639 RepID=A0A239LYQ3_9BURK|nr:hypothetical protein [Noviherbaspirillum humi]SNT34923.1 hypothetical protein SAMN06265795_12737 [Noviherbaspirillum humi]